MSFIFCQECCLPKRSFMLHISRDSNVTIDWPNRKGYIFRMYDNDDQSVAIGSGEKYAKDSRFHISFPVITFLRKQRNP